MIRWMVIFLLTSAIFTTQAGEIVSSGPKDSSGYLFEYDLKYFGSNYRIDMNYRYLLETLYEMVSVDTALRIHVRGHVCCGPGYRLSKKRAKQVYKYLLKLGVPRDRLSYKGYSNTKPIVSQEKTEEDEAKNRRVDFIIYRYH